MSIDDNGKPSQIFKPKTTQHLTGNDITTVTSAVFDSSIVKITPLAAINYNVTTDAITTDDAYLATGEVMYIKVVRGVDKVSFLGSTQVYLTSLE